MNCRCLLKQLKLLQRHHRYECIKIRLHEYDDSIRPTKKKDARVYWNHTPEIIRTYIRDPSVNEI
jgi:hypothetical protein